jgi:hypothetical protein
MIRSYILDPLLEQPAKLLVENHGPYAGNGMPGQGLLICFVLMFLLTPESFLLNIIRPLYLIECARGTST